MYFRITIRINKNPYYPAIQMMQRPHKTETFFLCILPFQKKDIEKIAEDFLSSIKIDWRCSMQIIDITEMDSGSETDKYYVWFDDQNKERRCFTVDVKRGDDIYAAIHKYDCWKVVHVSRGYFDETFCEQNPVITNEQSKTFHTTAHLKTVDCPEHGAQIGDKCWCGYGGEEKKCTWQPDDAGYHPNMRIPKKRKVVSDECQYKCELPEVEIIDAEIINVLHDIYKMHELSDKPERKALAKAAYDKLMQMLSCN